MRPVQLRDKLADKFGLLRGRQLLFLTLQGFADQIKTGEMPLK
jgi:hypothetical protein